MLSQKSDLTLNVRSNKKLHSLLKKTIVPYHNFLVSELAQAYFQKNIIATFFDTFK